MMESVYWVVGWVEHYDHWEFNEVTNHVWCLFWSRKCDEDIRITSDVYAVDGLRLSSRSSIRIMHSARAGRTFLSFWPM